MIIGLLEEYGKFKYLWVLISFLLKTPGKLALFMYGVITKALCGVVIQMILLENFLGLFLHNYQEELKIIKGNDFVFESAELMDYKLHSVRLRRGGSYIKSPEWLLHKGTTINQKNEITKKEFKNIFKKIKHEDKDFSSHQEDSENFEQNNESIVLNVLFSSQNNRNNACI